VLIYKIAVGKASKSSVVITEMLRRLVVLRPARRNRMIEQEGCSAMKQDLNEAVGGWFSLYTDGSAPCNSSKTPGPIGAGAVLKSPQGGVLAQESWPLGVGTNNEAEYWGLIYGLCLAQKWGVRYLKIHLDSELVIKQIKGVYRVKEPRLKPRWEMALALLEGFSKYRLIWIPRDQNKLADTLSKQGRYRGQGHQAPPD
jgi:ribonuclease HI